MLGSNFPLPAQGHGISGREEGQWEGNGQVSWPHRGTAITDPCRELPEDPRAEGRSWGVPSSALSWPLPAAASRVQGAEGGSQSAKASKPKLGDLGQPPSPL